MCFTIRSSVAGVLLWRTPVVKFSTLRRDRKELPYSARVQAGKRTLFVLRLDLLRPFFQPIAPHAFNPLWAPFSQPLEVLR